MAIPPTNLMQKYSATPAQYRSALKAAPHQTPFPYRVVIILGLCAVVALVWRVL